jgi:hypothetical protein
MLPNGIDGAATPELIPDFVAYSLFFSNAAEQQRRERAKLSRAQLSEPDIQAVIPILAAFQQQTQALEDSFRSGVSPATDIDPFRAQLVGIARAAMQTAVSAEGLAKLDAFVQSEKRHIVYPFPTQP